MKISSRDESSLQAFVTNGFSNWKNAVERFKGHECSQNHRDAAIAVVSRRNDTNISGVISKQAQQDREDARHCLFKIFETVRFMAVQDIPMRGHNESESNFIQLLELRSLDDDKLRFWMKRTTYKWISHDIINEILSILSRQVLEKVLSNIVRKPFFAFMADETTDISKKEQMSANVRVVDDYMAIQEYFVGFYEVPVTDAETLFAVIKDIFLRYQFQFNRCRGQCYDGAYNMSGAITGLQTRVRETEPRALYTLFIHNARTHYIHPCIREKSKYV